MLARDFSSFLRPALLADAAVSGATGLLLAGAAPWLSPWLGLPVALLQFAGLGLLPFAAYVGLLARMTHVPASRVRLVVLVNAAWVVASVGLLMFVPASVTWLGYAFVAFQAVVVALFAEVQWAASRVPAAA